jgi:tetratricopeptide (TPR) repeat protein
VGLLLAAMAVLTAPAAGQAPSSEAQAALRSGDYEEAIELYRDLLRAEPGAVQMRTDLMDALVATGAYAEAIEVGRTAPDPVATANATGEALLRVGRIDEAQAAFEQAVNRGGPSGLTAEVNLAELLFNRGDIDEAMRRFDRFIDVYNGADGRLSARDLLAVGRAVRYLARSSPNLFHDALRAVDEALALDPTWLAPRVLAGDLFLEKYESSSAQTEYQTALELNPNHPGALLGMASAAWFNGTAGEGEAIERVLEVDPNNIDAKTMRARQRMTRQDFEGAREELEQALEINPASLVALTQLAGIHMLLDDARGWKHRVQTFRTRTRLFCKAETTASIGRLSAAQSENLRREDCEFAKGIDLGEKYTEV